MRHRQSILTTLLGIGLLTGLYACAPQAAQNVPPHRFFHVQLGAGETQPLSGRLLLFVMDAKAAKAASKDGAVTEVDAVSTDRDLDCGQEHRPPGARQGYRYRRR
jgi:hypothetical protein